MNFLFVLVRLIADLGFMRRPRHYHSFICAGMQGGKEKKLTVFTKNLQGKKPALEIETNSEHDFNSKMASTHPLPSHPDDPKHIASLTSPTNLKSNGLSASAELHEADPASKKPQPMQKKISLKESQPAPSKIEQPKPVMNGFVSPKAAFNKDKVLISYTSEKNLGTGPKAKEPQRDSKAVKIEQLQKIIEESKIRQSELSVRESELGAEVERLRTENAALLAETVELKKRIEKYRISNEETKKMLKQRIHSFNQEGGEMQALRTQIKTLEERVQALLTENQSLKADLNRFSEYTPKQLSALRGSMATSVVREVQLEGSRVSQLYLKQSDDQLLEFANLENMEDNLDLESYISEAEESCLEDYKNNVEIFDSIKAEYQHILEDIEIRYRGMVEDFQTAAKTQAGEIYSLEACVNELQEQREQRPTPPLSLALDEVLLRNEREIATLNLSIFDLRAANKELVQDIEHHRAQCRFLSAQLDIERLKRQFRNENDKFEYNVVKLNLLGIIEKLKSQIDKEKARCSKLNDKCQALRAHHAHQQPAK